MLQSGCDAVVHIGEKVIALIQTKLTNVQCQTKRHEGMTLVAAGFLHLTQIAERTTFVGNQNRHQVADKLIATIIHNLAQLAAVGLERALMVVFVERHTLVVHVDIITQDADGHHAQGIAKTPVRPVVARTLTHVWIAPVGPGVVTAAEKVNGWIVEHSDDPLAELVEILTAPAVVVAHQLGCVGPFVAVDAGCERDVGVASQTIALTDPLHHDAYGCIGVLTGAANLPAQRILICHGGATGTVHIVLPRTSTANHGVSGPCGDVCM